MSGHEKPQAASRCDAGRFEGFTDQELEDLAAVVEMATKEGVYVPWLLNEMLEEQRKRGLSDSYGLEYWTRP